MALIVVSTLQIMREKFVFTNLIIYFCRAKCKA
ncbi:hypothetical protein FHS60_001806 [Alloprevotella rava]|uniref:Uncharacterized protein n=1 Tax=Alloprevotella rava TaxID=671218 RepID=A0A7W5UXE7_9BACT|nr:hypothetical protein [Alloprevotella rava]